MARGKGIEVGFSGDNTALKKSIKDSERALAQFSRSVKATGRVMGAGLKAASKAGAAAIGAVGVAAAAGVRDVARLDTGVREIATLLGDVNDADLSRIRGEVEALSREFGVGAQQVAAAYYDALSAGIPADAVSGFLGDAGRFAVAGVTDLGSSVDLLTSALNAFGLGAADAGRVSDVLFGAVRAGKTTVDEIARSFFQVGPVAASVGAEVEEVAAWLASSP